MSEQVCVVGGGYVGLATAVCLTMRGNNVTLVETDAGRREKLLAGMPPFFEAGMAGALTASLESGKLQIAQDAAECAGNCSTVVIAVGTPVSADGECDLSQVNAAVLEVAQAASDECTVVIKSSVPPGTTNGVQQLISARGRDLPVVFCPEFLREGSAIHDSLHPSRLVVGADDDDAMHRVVSLFRDGETEVIRTDPTSAELIKYASNAYLGMKISFINGIANLCARIGADVNAVARGIGADPRVGAGQLRPGIGYGGSCIPKDIRALLTTASREGVDLDLLQATANVNRRQMDEFVVRIMTALSATSSAQPKVAIFGLAFKPGTDDMREAASIYVIEALVRNGVTVAATDPAAIESAKRCIEDVTFVEDAYVCAQAADVVALVTEWPELVALDWKRIAQAMRGDTVLDGRNALDPVVIGRAGLNYVGIGGAERQAAEKLQIAAGRGALPPVKQPS